MKIIFKEEVSKRLDKYLVGLKIEELYSRSYIEKLINEKLVSVNSENVKKSYLLSFGDVIEIQMPEQKDTTLEPQDIPLEIAYEDDYLVIVNKPANMTVHPALGNPDGTLVNALLYKFKENLSSGNDNFRPGIVHRLDKDTTGLILVAKDDRTHSLLSEMFAKREIKKYYKALVLGNPSEETGTIETLMERSKLDRKKMAVSDTGKKAVTHYKVDKLYHGFTLLDIQLETGRTHQIRVHFSHFNNPVFGDQTYSTPKRALNLVHYNYHKKVKHILANHMLRQALHAYKLEFIHPVTKEEISVEIGLPKDMAYVVKRLDADFS
jgi:23S rRNA pseudouridine1911/1915/1917 synthase